VVTKDGNRVMSSALPITVEGIERWASDPGY
jgi:hypothetical protein